MKTNTKLFFNMKSTLLSLLLLCSLGVYAQDAVVTRQKKQQTTTSNPKQHTATNNNNGKVSGKKRTSTSYREPEVKIQTSYTLPSTISSYSNAANWYQKAMNDDVQAMCDLGKAYLKGKDGAKKNGNEAFRWLKKAAEAGNANAMAWLGDCYEGGHGTPQDYRQAYYWDKKSADLGDAYGLNNLGTFYEDGRGGIVSVDYSRSFELYKRSAEKGDPVGQMDLGNAYIDGFGTQADPNKGIEWLNKSVAQNCPEAIYALAACYMNGRGVTMDKNKAFELLTKSSSLGSANGTYGLSQCYLYGIAVAKDTKKAETLLKQSVAEGSEWGKLKLAECYLMGTFNNNVGQLPEAYKLFCEVSEDSEAQFYIAWYYMHGLAGIAKDQNQAFAYYKKSAEAGYARSMNNLGICYQYGYGCTRDVKEAFKWYEKAANLGNTTSMYNLAVYYTAFSPDNFATNPNNVLTGGPICKVDLNKAYQLYKAAADKGNKLAMYMLGMYYEGLLDYKSKKDKKKASEWYTKFCGRYQKDGKDAARYFSSESKKCWGKSNGSNWSDYPYFELNN